MRVVLRGRRLFYVVYIRQELRRRAGRTVLTTLGLAVGIGLVVTITATSAGLDQAQREVLTPLQTVGTDLLVTRPVRLVEQTPTTTTSTTVAPTSSTRRGATTTTAGATTTVTRPAAAAAAGEEPAEGELSEAEERALLEENQSVVTDLAALGKPGDRFVRDFFLPATQLTFPATEIAKIREVPGVEATVGNLTLLATHQEGTIPEIVATFQTGGETLIIDEEIAPPSAAEEAQIERCKETQARRGVVGRDANAICFPERFRRFRREFRTPTRTLTSIIDPPPTDIRSEPYTVAGVDPKEQSLGLVTAAQITEGRYLDADGGDETVLAGAYAARKGLAVGETLPINGRNFEIVGLARSPLGGQGADVYLPLRALQELSRREDRINVVLVRAESAGAVDDLATRIERALPGTEVSDSGELADQVSGSLLDAARLSDELGLAVAAVVLLAAFLIAVLLTLSAVAKRVRELGTLRAIGWSPGRLVRLMMGEAVVLGLLGGLVGIPLGMAGAAAVGAWAPNLEAHALGLSGPGAEVFAVGGRAAGEVARIPVDAPVEPLMVLAAVVLALIGGVVSGVAGAVRTSRLRPADALRQLG